MTAQIAEKLLYEGREVSMCSSSLSSYFTLAGIDPGFESNCTALWRGYVGSWEILDGRLYLIGLSGTRKGGRETTLATFFPDFPNRVFAHWYSGQIRIPQGQMLEYVHMGYASTYESDLYISFENGVVSEIAVRQNGKSDNPVAEEGYAVKAMSIFHYRN